MQLESLLQERDVLDLITSAAMINGTPVWNASSFWPTLEADREKSVVGERFVVDQVADQIKVLPMKDLDCRELAYPRLPEWLFAYASTGNTEVLMFSQGKAEALGILFHLPIGRWVRMVDWNEPGNETAPVWAVYESCLLLERRVRVELGKEISSIPLPDGDWN